MRQEIRLQVGIQMIRHMQQQRPYLFVVGMGDPANPLPRLLRASNWTVFPVPFLFRVENAGRFLREIKTLRSSAAKRMAASAAALHRGRMAKECALCALCRFRP